MISFVDVNYLAVLGAAIFNMALGAAWYSPLLFGKQWITAMGKSEEELAKMKEGVGKSYAVMFVGALVTAYILSQFIVWAGASSVAAAVQIGVLVWLGFVFTTSLAGVMFEQRPKPLFSINAGYYLVSFVATAAILVLWG